jgi:hypothetical protein
MWPATLAALYPATKPDRHARTVSSSPQSAQQEMRHEKTLLPLVDEHNHCPATASLSGGSKDTTV